MACAACRSGLAADSSLPASLRPFEPAGSWVPSNDAARVFRCAVCDALFFLGSTDTRDQWPATLVELPPESALALRPEASFEAVLELVARRGVTLTDSWYLQAAPVSAEQWVQQLRRWPVGLRLLEAVEHFGDRLRCQALGPLLEDLVKLEGSGPLAANTRERVWRCVERLSPALDPATRDRLAALVDPQAHRARVLQRVRDASFGRWPLEQLDAELSELGLFPWSKAPLLPGTVDDLVRLLLRLRDEGHARQAKTLEAQLERRLHDDLLPVSRRDQVAALVEPSWLRLRRPLCVVPVAPAAAGCVRCRPRTSAPTAKAWPTARAPWLRTVRVLRCEACAAAWLELDGSWMALPPEAQAVLDPDCPPERLFEHLNDERYPSWRCQGLLTLWSQYVAMCAVSWFRRAPAGLGTLFDPGPPHLDSSLDLLELTRVMFATWAGQPTGLPRPTFPLERFVRQVFAHLASLSAPAEAQRQARQRAALVLTEMVNERRAHVLSAAACASLTAELEALHAR